MEEPCVASVVLDSNIDRPLDYAIPKSLIGRIYPGMRVEVPLRKTVRLGTVLLLKMSSNFSLQSIKELSSQEPLISKELLLLAEWMAKYYATPLSKVLRLFLPPSVRKGMDAKQQLFVKPLVERASLAHLCILESSLSQRKALDVLLKHPKGILLSQLLQEANISRSPIDSLVKRGVVSLEHLSVDRSLIHEADFFPTKPKQLNEEQRAALEKICLSLNAHRFETHLLFGVTGSGKTEVFLQAITQTLSLGKTALVLVPEIALTTQTLERMRARFQTDVALLHHQMSDGMRRDAWHKIQSGQTHLVVGPRSAIFSPLKNLGLIIVDEEHEGSYKQTDEMPCYHARDLAVVRGKLEGVTVVLASATPSLESYHHALKGKYHLSTLTTRPKSVSFPQVTIVDMRSDSEKKNFLFSSLLLQEMEKRYKNGEQTLLFLNRRGFHSAQVCQSCSHILGCPHCSTALTFYKGDNRLSCHLCSFEQTPPPRQCPKCGSSEALKFRGAGTELVEKALHAIFPEIRTLRLDRDTTRHRGSHEQFFKQFKAGKADVLIGTQMVAKGLHFPSVTLVGVLNADAALQIPDFRSAESVFQLLTQVAGRSGRGAIPGDVILQTHLPGHPVIQAAASQNYASFSQLELESRQLFSYPPFSRLVKIVISGPDLEATTSHAQQVQSYLIQQLPSTYEIGPVNPCGHARIQGKHRLQFLIKGRLPPVLGPLPSHPNIRILIDPDPISIY